MDLYDTATMEAVIQRIKMPGNFLLSLFFASIVEFETEKVEFDRLDEDLTIAPFVSPLAAAKSLAHPGYQQESLQPAYLKPMHPLRPQDMLRRMAGEPRGGSLSPQQRKAAKMGETLMKQSMMIDRRLEVMTADFLMDGILTISGDDYDAVTVDFGRTATHDVTLLTSARWGESGVSPYDDVDAWADIVGEDVGAAPTVVVMTKDAWALFWADQKVKDALDREMGQTSSLELGFTPGVPGSPIFKGRVGQLEIYVYNDTYVNDAGSTVKLLPDYTVIIGSPQAVDGVRAFGAIQDDDALFAVDKWPSTWNEKNPSVRFVLTQSAPLLVPKRVDGTFRATVR